MADKFKPCSIDVCKNNAQHKDGGRKGYCNAHYLRLRKYGHPLGGGPHQTTRGDPLRFIYEVALSHTGGDCLIWPFSRNRGYAQIILNNKNVGVSRYICTITNGAPPTAGHDAAHSCGKGHEGCVAPGHLGWKTKTENQADRLLHGTHGRGENSATAKLTEMDVQEIRAILGTRSQCSIAIRFGVSDALVSRIKTGKSWGWLDGAKGF